MNDYPEDMMMWAVTCPKSGVVQVKKVPIPRPESGQVLIKVEACPINPSDLFFMKGSYDEGKIFDIHYPNAPGWEGSGTVVSSGGGVMGWLRTGKRVAFTRSLKGNSKVTGGAYQQYCIADAATLNPIPDEMPFDLGAMSFVNPITAVGLLERV